MSISYFFGAAAGGFVLLAAIGIQALVALFSSIPLTRKHKAECPGFDYKRAYRRIAMVTVLILLLVSGVTAAVIHFAPLSASMGYLLGMILAFICCLKRMSPNNEQNQKNYEDSYADCYPPSDVNPDDAPASADAAAPVDAPAAPSEPAAPAEPDDDVVPAPAPHQ
jgi:Ca2+/Na+ antiporter